MLGTLVCMMLDHRIERNRVWHDGLDHRSSCRRCGSPMIKRGQEWRPFVTDSDLDGRRKPHPRYDEADA